VVAVQPDFFDTATEVCFHLRSFTA